jgi:hypothetical protein
LKNTKLRLANHTLETLHEGDEVASRPEHDVYGGVSFKPIEEVFVRTGRVLHLHLSDGQLIRTTPEQPFWVEEFGWTPADVLRADLRLATLGGEWVTVEEAFDTGEYETVYNCRVAEWHTYFVSGEEYVTAVWAHNAYSIALGILEKGLPAFAAANDAKFWDQWKREHFNIPESRLFHPTSFAFPIGASGFGKAFSLVVPNAEMIFVLLRGMTLYEIPYRASTETVERSITLWEIWELMTNNRYIDKRPAMRFDWGDGTSMMDYPAFRERMRDVFLPHARTEAQENPSWATSRGLKPYTIRSIIRLGYTVGEVETMLATP